MTDGSYVVTTCSAAAIRTVVFNIPLLASGGATGGGLLQVRTDDAGTTSRVYGSFSTPTLPGGTFQSTANSQTGFSFYC